MAKEKKKGFVLRALDTVEHVGNALPNPATIFLILTGVVIVLSAIPGQLKGRNHPENRCCSQPSGT